MLLRKTDFSKIRIEYLLAFQELVKCESFSETAKTFRKTQSAISQQLKELEKALGNITLIERTSQRFELTKYGRLLHETLDEIFEKLNEMYTRIFHDSKQDEFEISIVASSIPGDYILPEKMIHFQQKYPKTSFSIKIKNTSLALQELFDKNVSICAVGEVEEIKQQDCEIQEIGTDAIVLFARTNHPIHLSKNKLSILSRYPWILREEGSATRNCFLRSFPKTDQLNIVLELQDNTAIINAVQASDALSALSYNLVSLYKNAGIKEIKIPGITPITRKMYLVKIKDVELKTYEQSFWNFCKIQNKKY